MAKVPYGFDGYFEVKSAATVPTYSFVAQPLQASATLEVALWREAELSAWVDTVVDAPRAYESGAHGVVFLTVRDCHRKPLSGIRISTTATDPLTRIIYLGPADTRLSAAITDERGTVAVVNAPTGLVTFAAEVAATRETLGAARVLVRAGAVSTLDVLPSGR